MNHFPDLLWIARYDYRADWILNSHHHDFYQIIYILEGVANVEVNDNEYEIHAESLLFIPPGFSHGLKALYDNGVKTLDAKFRIEKNADLAESLSDLPIIISDSDHQIRQLLDMIRMEGIKKKSWHVDMCVALFIQVLIILCRNNEGRLKAKFNDIYEDQISDDVIAKSMNWMKLHYSENIKVSNLGNALGYSPEYLCRKFRNIIGISPHQYLMKIRIDKAKELLKELDKPIKEIAYIVGFKSIHHFSRIFKEYTGQSPGKWRNRECHYIWKNITINPQFINKDITSTPDGISPCDK